MPRLKKKKTLFVLILVTLFWILWFDFSKPRLSACTRGSVIPTLLDPKRYEWNETCKDDFCIRIPPKVDIQMLDVYSKISFEHTHEGEWEEGWCVQHDPSVWTQHEKLKVIVVPHSHNDPGWLMTYDEYYEYKTKHILNGMLRNLKENPDMTFIWAEISFFSRWFESLTQRERGEVKKLIHRNQLEIVTGGWVMADEANSHWYSLIMQLSEGQSWLKSCLNVTPVSSWACDPFGHSPTMAYILRETGIEQMVIGRTHYIVKKHFAMYKDIEFQWKQLFDPEQSKKGILTHMLPFSSYAIKYSHGPNRLIGKLFDFRESQDWFYPWEERAEEITLQNIHNRADLLVDQWQKKATLYKTKAILVPHGDDFRYQTQQEWDAQRINLKKLFNFINDSPKYNVEVKFGTISDYFKEISVHDSYPTLSGDFFTYSDENEDYWSGFFTTRPYHKRMDRILLHLIRSAEIIHALNGDRGDKYLLEARRVHSLYQHHDGITGTARERVVEDYARMNQNAISLLEKVIDPLADSIVPDSKADDFKYIQRFKSNNQTVKLFNPLPHNRKETVEVFSSTYSISVEDDQQKKIKFQIEPTVEWLKGWRGIYIPEVRDPVVYRVTFVAEIPGFSFKIYKIIEIPSGLDEYALLTNFTLYHDKAHMRYPFDDPFKDNFIFKSPEEFSISNYAFDDKGFLKSIKLHQTVHKVRIDFFKYLTHRWWSNKSGAYLFLPRGNAQKLYTNRRVVMISRGAIASRVTAGFEFGIHEFIIKDSSIEIFNKIDLSKRKDQEILMRLNTDIDNHETFFTDLNAFQIVKRERLEKLPLQGNYYPIPTTIFLQDKNLRLTILSGQPLGGSSLKSGQLEIMQDRFLSESDGRGLGEGVKPDFMTINTFRIVLENKPETFIHPSHPSGFHTPKSHKELLNLLNPIMRIINSETLHVKRGVENLSGGFEIVTLRRINENLLGLVMHKMYLEEEDPDLEYQVNLKTFFKMENIQIFKSNIVLTEKYEEINSVILFKQMETKAFLIVFKNGLK